MVTLNDKIRTLQFLLAGSFNTKETTVLTAILNDIQGGQPMSFIPASEARERSAAALDQIYAHHERKLQQEIENAIEHGRDKVIFNDELAPITIAVLRKLGYIVDICNDYDSPGGLFYRIIWEATEK